MVVQCHRFQPYGDALVALWSGVACEFGRGGEGERPYKEATAAASDPLAAHHGKHAPR
jgi:hypothetical protein